MVYFQILTIYFWHVVLQLKYGIFDYVYITYCLRYNEIWLHEFNETMKNLEMFTNNAIKYNFMKMYNGKILICAL